MMTLHTHITPVDRDWVAAANAQDQAEADALTLLDAGLDASGRWHEPSKLRRGAINGLILEAIILAVLIVIALAVKCWPHWRIW